MNKMIGATRPFGPGGRCCPCCGDSPNYRVKGRRAAKRAERAIWKNEVR